MVHIRQIAGRKGWKIRVLCGCFAALLAVAFWPAAGADAAPGEATARPGIGAELSARTVISDFASPPRESKPMIRYWIPEAAVEEGELRKDLQEIAALGFGGIEVVALSILSGGVTSAYKFGTSNWDQAMDVIIDEARTQGLSVDVTNGPGWPVSMPGVADADHPGSAYELTWAKAFVTAGAVMSGPVPPRNTGRTAGTTDLFAAYAYRLTAAKTLDFSSRVDLMPVITLNAVNQADSTIDWTAPAGGNGWEVLLFFAQPTGQKNGDYFVVDHFGAAGAQACRDYWAQTFQAKPGLQYVSSIFNDSLEYQVDKEWTRDFQAIFQAKKGYDITPYLPAIGGPDYYQTKEGPWYSFTDSDLTQQIRNDYNDVITWCFNEYHLRPLQAMAAGYGMNIRYQVAYNKPLQVEASALSVGIPECETLNRGSLDFQRLMASAVHMTGKNILSQETNAEFGNAFGQTCEDIGWWQKRAWAAGVSRQVLHGASYSGVWNGGNLTNAFGNFWPGWSGFSGLISNDWNRAVNRADTADYMTWIARNNYVMQKKTKVDVAVFRSTYTDKYTKNGGDGQDWYPDGGALNRYGYSYEFVSPEILDLDSATVTGGVLNAEGPAYKAILVHDQERISYAAALKLKALAEAGLPLVVVGAAPEREMYYGDVLAGHTDEDIQTIFREMLALKNAVRTPDYSDVPRELMDMNVRADASFAAQADILTKHTTDQAGDYYYLYNYNKMSQADVNATRPEGGTAYPGMDKSASFKEKDALVTLKGRGRPWLLNPWDGSVTPITTYEIGNGTVTLPLHFEEDEAKLIALLPDEQAKAAGLQPRTLSVRSADSENDFYYEEDRLALKGRKNGTIQVTSQTGETWQADISGAKPQFDIAKWTLEIDSLVPGATRFFRDSVKNSLAPITIRTLKPWKDLESGWKNVSGTGTYTATFELEKGWSENGGAWLDLGEVEDTWRISVNGIQLPFQNQINTKVDIGPYTKSGENTVRIAVSTTLFNRFLATAPASLLQNPLLSMRTEPSPCGLLGKNGRVTVAPYVCALLTRETSQGLSPPLSLDGAVVQKIADRAWTGKQIRPAFSATAGGKPLRANLDYTVTYGANKEIGRGTIQVKGKGNYTGIKTVSFRIVPAKVSSAAVIRTGKGRVTFTWKKSAAAQKITKLQIRWRINSAAPWKYRAAASSQTSLTVSNLKKGRAYQFQVRAYKKVNGIRSFGPWSVTRHSKKVS